MKALKIVFYTDVYLPQKDGVVTHILAVRKELERRGHKVYIVTPTDNTGRAEKKDDRLISVPGIDFNRYKGYKIPINFLELLKVNEHVKEISPDVVHAHTPFIMGVLADRLAHDIDVPLIGTFHTHIFGDTVLSAYASRIRLFRAIQDKTLIAFTRLFYGNCDVTIAPSEFVKRELLRIGLKRISVVNSGIDLGATSGIMSKKYARRMLGLRSDKRILLYLGRIGPEKNLKSLVRAAPGLGRNGFDVIIAGDGPARTELEKAASSLKNVTFLGFVDSTKKIACYRSADVFCNPSLFETQSLVDLEALANGIPILVPKRSAQAEYLNKGKCGETFNTYDSANLVKKAVSIASGSKLYETKKVAKFFDVRSTVDELLKLYSHCINKPQTKKEPIPLSRLAVYGVLGALSLF